MIKLGIEVLKPGMILDQPVRNRQGVLLLEAGARITKKNIRIFKSWGVSEIMIKGDPANAKNKIKPRQTRVAESVQLQLKKRFSDVLDDPVMVEIYKAARNQLIKSDQEQQ